MSPILCRRYPRAVDRLPSCATLASASLAPFLQYFITTFNAAQSDLPSPLSHARPPFPPNPTAGHTWHLSGTAEPAKTLSQTPSTTPFKGPPRNQPAPPTSRFHAHDRPHIDDASSSWMPAQAATRQHKSRHPRHGPHPVAGAASASNARADIAHVTSYLFLTDQALPLPPALPSHARHPSRHAPCVGYAHRPAPFHDA